MVKNPFTISFGKKPDEYIDRLEQSDRIMASFTSEPAVSQTYMITGVRGSGKTVLLSDISSKLKEEGWYVIPLNPTADMLNSLASKMYALPGMKKLMIKAKVDLSFLGLGVSIEQGLPVSDSETAISQMLAELLRTGKKLLVTVDEVINSANVRQFVSAFQIFIREEYPIYLLMTGLYDNIYDLQNDKSITFLYRAPKVEMEPLNLNMIKVSYKRALDITEDTAANMARLTKGYSFAYQVLGYLVWGKGDDLETLLPEYDQYLQEYVYEKIWSELPSKEKEIMASLSASSKTKTKEIRDKVGLTSQAFGVYRDRLKRKGVIDTSERGFIDYSLPRFAEYIDSLYY